MKILEFLKETKDDAEYWAQGRMWQVRLLALVLFAWVLFGHLSESRYYSIFNGVNLGIHELAHILFGPFGMFIEIASGSFVQCAVPVGAMYMFLRQRDYFAIAFCFGWLSTNLFEVAIYAEDARSMSLRLVGPGGGERIHDWNYLLSTMGMLTWDGFIAFLLRAAATVSMLVCQVSGGWVLWKMFSSGQQKAL